MNAERYARIMSKHPVRPVTVSQKIGAPAPDVLAFIIDTRNDPIWCPNVESAEIVTDEPIGPNSKFRYTQHLDQPGRDRITFDGDVEVIELDDRSVTWSVTDRFQDRRVTCTVDPSGDGSIVTQTTEASFHRSPGLARHLYPFFARRTLKDQLRHLRAHFDG